MSVCARMYTYMCVCVYVCVCIYIYIYPVCNPKIVHRNTSISKYSIPVINLERSLEQNLKP